MRRLFIPALLFIVSSSWSQTNYQPIEGELLEHWNTAYSTNFPHVGHIESLELPDGITDLRITGIEVERDSLNIYLLGIAPDIDIPFLLGSSGYKGNYNFAKSDSRYLEDVDEIRLLFQMPFSAGYYAACYRWNVESGSLECVRYYSGDPSQEALERADSLMAEGSIAEAIDELNNMFYPGNYYSTDEMIARLLRSINRAAGEAEAEDNFEEAVSLFGELADFLHTDREWFTAFSDSLDYVNCDYSEYMGLGEYAMIMNNYAYYLEQTDDLDKSLVVLRKVLDLKPERMVAHINIADVLWELDETNEAGEHYQIYVEMMVDRELTHQIPDYVHERLIQFPRETEVSTESVTLSTGPIEEMEFACIPSGHFLMGSPSSEEGRYDYEGPQHRVNISSFELMTTEVTQGMWLEAMGTDLRHNRDLLNPEWSLLGEGYYYPMYYLSWDDCQRFAAVMNDLDPDYIYRLPSEAEWEYACRAGTNTAFYWGDSSSPEVISNYCWYKDNSDYLSHPVAQKEPNQWGLYDITGNVSEWCEDTYHESYSGAPSDGSAWVGREDSLRVCRCSNRHYSALNCRSAIRQSCLPGFHYSNLGFRLVRVRRTPEMVVKVLMEAYKNANGYLLLTCSSTAVSEELRSVLELFEEYPDLTVTTLSEMGVDITAAEAENVTSGYFMSVYLGYDTELPNFDYVELEIGDAIIDDETAIVPVSRDSNSAEFKLVKENGAWRVTDSFEGFL